jgi:hypothetical protein
MDFTDWGFEITADCLERWHRANKALGLPPADSAIGKIVDEVLHTFDERMARVPDSEVRLFVKFFSGQALVEGTSEN